MYKEELDYNNEKEKLTDEPLLEDCEYPEEKGENLKDSSDF